MRRAQDFSPMRQYNIALEKGECNVALEKRDYIFSLHYNILQKNNNNIYNIIYIKII